jgi:opacity protein-like surface antigen
VKRLLLSIALAAVAVGSVFAASAAAHLLSINAASTKSFYYAKRACNVDPACDRYGVLNCRRQQAHVVICRVFNDRDTAAQGRYRCFRLVRVAYRYPGSHKPTITGFSRWNC